MRPAIVLAGSELDVTVCFVTTQADWKEPFDVVLAPTMANGLKKASLIRVGKIATLDRTLAKGLLGNLSASEMAELNGKLKLLLRLD